MLFGRKQLRESWAQQVRLPEIGLVRNGFLLDVVINQPDLRAVILGSVADQDNPEERLVGSEIDFVMELRDQRAKLLKEGYADLIEVLIGVIRIIVVAIGRGEVGDVQVEANGLRLRGDLPFRGSIENAHMAHVNRGNARRNRLGFQGMVDRGEQDRVIGDLDNGAPAGKVGDDFLLLGTERGSSRENGQQTQGGESEHCLHKRRVAHCAAPGAWRWFPGTAGFAKIQGCTERSTENDGSEKLEETETQRKVSRTNPESA